MPVHLTMRSCLFYMFCTIAIVGNTSAETVTDVTATPGDDVWLACPVCKTSGSTADWFVVYQKALARQVVQICSLGKVLGEYMTRFETTRGCDLLIRGVRLNDTGEYRCIGDDGLGETKVTRLMVFDSVSSTSVTLLAGDPLVIRCKTDKNGEKSGVDWYYKKMTGTVPSQVCSVGHVINGFRARFALDTSHVGEDNLYLRRADARQNDSGLYTCVTDGGLGSKQSTLVHVLLPRSSDTEVKLVATKGAPTTPLLCSLPTDAYSASWWFQQSQSSPLRELTNGEHVFNTFAHKFYLSTGGDAEDQRAYNLVIRSVSADDSGLYSCIVDFGDMTGQRTTFHFDVQDWAIKGASPGTNPDNKQPAVYETHEIKSLSLIAIFLIGAAVILVMIVIGLILLVRCPTHKTNTAPLLPLFTK